MTDTADGIIKLLLYISINAVTVECFLSASFLGGLATDSSSVILYVPF